MDTRNNIDQLLGQMRTAAALAAGRPAPASRKQQVQSGGFADVLQSAIVRTNETQNGAQALARRFETGDKDVQLHDVMVSLQKANISFQQMVQVRNRLVAAYQDIMNMQV